MDPQEQLFLIALRKTIALSKIIWTRYIFGLILWAMGLEEGASFLFPVKILSKRSCRALQGFVGSCGVLDLERPHHTLNTTRPSQPQTLVSRLPSCSPEFECTAHTNWNALHRVGAYRKTSYTIGLPSRYILLPRQMQYLKLHPWSL